MVSELKKQFPIFAQTPELIYLDSAATTQKPNLVVDAIANQLLYENGSPHRGAHKSSVIATKLYHEAKEAVQSFIGARDTSEIVFTKNASEALNLIAYGYGLTHVSKGQNIVVAITSHHSNLVPWQMVAKKNEAELRYLYLDEDGYFTKESLENIDQGTALVAIPVISNAYGVRHEFEKVIALAKKVGAVTVIDGAQAVGHMPVNVREWDCDFFVFSGHKIYAPQGIGVLYGKREILENVSPFLLGGDMIEYVSEQETTFAGLPERLEAGTQNVTGAHGLRTAIEFIQQIGVEQMALHERSLVEMTLAAFEKLDYIKVIGPKDSLRRGGLITFMVEGVHPHDVASLLDNKGIAIRAGHHCCQPLMTYLKAPASCRVSFGIYNTPNDVEALIEGIKYVRKVFGYEY